ncbi:FAD binding domain-containing protein [Candidatus Poriferisocius sp.]|uniref:FAD binding domain-containing protein n=1 Tax=Candidatus Poriferisocius sp. TaxID=3101276 RepID=UPI003B02E9D6
MKPASFDYHAPETVADAVGLLAEHGDDAKLLAGGQSLVPLLAMRLTRFEHIVDLNRVEELFGVSPDNGGVRIGAMTRQAAVESDTAVAGRVPLLHLATPHIGHFQIRNRGTIGGSIAHADPASEYPAVMLALDGVAEIASASGNREVSAAEFFESTFTTAVAPDELLTALRFPSWEQPAGFAFDEIARRSGDFALAGAAVGIGADGDGRINRAAVGMLGVGPTPLRATSVEAALMGLSAADADPAEIGRLAADDMDPIGDVHASADYRRQAGSTLVGRVLAEALSQLTSEAGNG